jgi:hypothetical protein
LPPDVHSSRKSHSKERTMNQFARAGLGAAALTAAALPLLPAIAVADDGPHPSKAQIEYQERVAAATQHPTKAQIEYAERSRAAAGAPASATAGSRSQTTSRVPISDGGDAAAWQLALSAAAGAALTGGAVLASRQVSRHRQAIAG